MKWFQHHNDMLSKSHAQILLDTFGTKGPYAWVRLMEIFTEDFDVDNPGIFLESKRKIFNEIFPTCCQKTGKKILDFFQSVGWIKYKIEGKEIWFKCDIIRELADEYTQKVLKQRRNENIGTNSRDDVGTSFVSSSKKGTNNKLNTKEDDRERESFEKQLDERLK